MTDGLVDEQRLLQNRYRLVAPIARGGMAEVWEGIDEVLTRPVAIKVLLPHLAADAALRERFRREAVSAARLAHSNVVATFDTGEDGDVPFIVMELVRGRTLRSVLDEGPMTPAVARAVAVQIADALAAAHAAGVVHRDIKPANVLLCDGMPVGAPGSVKVADFGIARAASTTSSDLTQPGTLLGTTKYLSPEQVDGTEPDARSDVYALGVVLYEMLTGRAPFVADTPLATALAHVNAEPLKPRQIRAGIPRSLERIVLRAMAKDAGARFQSASDLAAALRSVDVGIDDAVPLVVRDPTPPAGSPQTFHRSERTWMLPAGVIVLTAGVLIVLALVLGRSDVGREILDRGGADGRGPARALPVVGIDVLDPSDGNEKNERLPNLIDGDESTTWETSRYSTQAFGGLKDHLGLRLDLGQPTDVRRVVVTSPTSGWDVEIYVSNESSDQLAPWGEPVARGQNVSGSATFDGLEAEGRYVLVLFTRLGADNRVEVNTITVAT